MEGELSRSIEALTGSVQSCSNARSADSSNGRYVARCEDVNVRDTTRQLRGATHPTFTVTAGYNGPEFFYWRMEQDRRVLGFAWSPDSTAVAVVTRWYDYTRFWILGHASIPHHSVYLEVTGVDGLFAQYTLRRDITYAGAALLKWTTP